MSLSTANQSLSQHPPNEGTYGEYLDGLLDEMARRPSLLYLAHYLLNYGREDGFFRHYTRRDAKPPDVKAIHARGCDWLYEQRQWDYREHARAIIEAREPWPHRLLSWKTWHEMRHYHGAGPMPAWLDPKNWPDPSREPEYRQPRRARTRKPISAIKAKINAKRRERRAAR